MLKGLFCAAGGALSPEGVLSPRARDVRQLPGGFQAAGTGPEADGHERSAAAESALAGGKVPPMTNAEAQVDSFFPRTLSSLMMLVWLYEVFL